MKNDIKFAVILAGCGVYDGAEIHEATFTLYGIAKHEASYDIFAPDIEQYHVVNHLSGQVSSEKRNVLVESARIARGNIKPTSELLEKNYDAVIFPGGFGVAKNLSDFAFIGEKCSVNEEIATIIKQFHSNKKPIGALCISPVIVARVLGNIDVTIGNDTNTASAIKSFGANHIETKHGEVAIDKIHKIFTTPCYMLDSSIVQIAEGAENIVKAMIVTINR
ncbi:MAG TPA: isoprenoid biosynthesis protein ElbB [Bacteroidales bacterium]|nr:MAG: isoprenoid biosynthesis protein ElbB [Bacteroidetes bacterium GWF2_33_38]HBF87452.1 isoprenoid biosynthesis protein ElbB [Bacteroidales bacterium]